MSEQQPLLANPQTVRVTEDNSSEGNQANIQPSFGACVTHEIPVHSPNRSPAVVAITSERIFPRQYVF